MTDEEYERWYERHAWDPSRYPGLVIEQDLSPAAWLEPLLDSRSFTVGMTAPNGYEAYARIFFPLLRSSQTDNGAWLHEQRRWTDVATENGHSVHALMEAETISRHSNGEPTGDRPLHRLDPDQWAALLPVLERHTSSEMGWFLLWDGFGNLSDRVFTNKVPKIHHAMRDFYLLHGPLGYYPRFPDDPSYCWPEDRSWCLCTDTDFYWSYLAGGQECVEEVLSIGILDAVATKPENPAVSGMDVINDPDGVVPRTP
jgi:hypothetical protein